MSGADDARKIDDALLRAFCAVQALCAGAIGIAYPAVLYALATWIFIFTGIVIARELTETRIRDERRRRQIFGYCWAALWHLWLPCCLGRRRSRNPRRWAAHQARARNQSKEQAARLLNHAAKRVISNSAQASQLVLNLLDDLTCDDEATRMRARDEAEDLLRTQWSSSVIGFHSCRQALLEKALIRSSSRAKTWRGAWLEEISILFSQRCRS